MDAVKCANCEHRKKKMNEQPCFMCDGNNFYKLVNEDLHYIPCYNCIHRDLKIDSAVCNQCVNNEISNYPNYKLDTTIPTPINNDFGIEKFIIEGV